MILLRVTVWTLLAVGWLFGCMATMLAGYWANDAKHLWNNRRHK